MEVESKKAKEVVPTSKTEEPQPKKKPKVK
jgi:hypothetical protein